MCHKYLDYTEPSFKKLKLDDCMEACKHFQGSCIYLNLLESEPSSENLLSIKDIFRADCEYCFDGEQDSWLIQDLLVSSYIIDIKWLFKEVRLNKIDEKLNRLLIIHGGSCNLDDTTEIQILNIAKNYEIQCPTMPLPYGVFHPKFLILKFSKQDPIIKKEESFIRLVITTANFLESDWKFKTQAVWVQDFLLANNSNGAMKNPFCEYFGMFLNHIISKIEHKKFWSDLIKQYDYDNATVDLVASVPGYHKGENMKLWGHLRMKEIMKYKTDLNSTLNIEQPNRICKVEQYNNEYRHVESRIICQFSSLGKFSEKWLTQEFGDSLNTCINEYTTKSSFELVYPTAEQVYKSLEGIYGGGSIPVKHNNITKSWISKILHLWGSGTLSNPSIRDLSVPHIKTFLRYLWNSDRKTVSIPWIFYGSHNLGPAAWGQLQNNQTQMCIRNYELGVIITPYTLYNNVKYIRTKRNRTPKFIWTKMETKSTPNYNIRVPFSIPPIQYKTNDTPWYIELLVDS
ncbi:tyrosyl-DNA phosphodiesterase family protein [Cryptosporidium muris RN66]|uniref:Tyrosyl-DNA phosphodiesterase family protein n=1 Tax=Cryptosporidium muris (strain RN66) TaxID=441375 RepID=B6AFR8_CRYMR|nr:tyrosyl-DNA phosphodiesterase family protein [Cryptosporidium muris RN66]EEA07059.1 tyrosyl-DNA phosphodiesterase family protein [Cryptosporidium muris RN66]|eukprot:XP_002141408.1 tyrosyl-DNA phosphodiesterase family protein [Cryptosporidium muris RN66]